MNKYRIFHQIAPPSIQAILPINKFATWHTWSDPFRAFLREADSEIRHLSAPRLRRVNGLKVYDQTFSWSPDRWKTRELRQHFTLFARSLDNVRPGRKIMLFDGLIRPDLDAKRLHALFALLRGTLVDLADDERAALYAPLGQVGKKAQEFPLHSDLYIPPMLFNVFDEVAADDSGASTFLSVATLRKLIPAVVSLPAARAKMIISFFEQEATTDRFEILYDLLHGAHRWVPELEQAMNQRQLRIKLMAGQGYLLHDRSWLHGRDAPKGGVPANRVHRLLYGARLASTRKTSAAPLSRAMAAK